MNRPSAQNVSKQAQDMLKRLGIDLNLAILSLILAVVSGLVAAILDRVLDLPAEHFLFTFAGILAFANGLSYAFFEGRETLAGAIMAAVNGFVAFLFWWILTKIIGDRDLVFGTYNPADVYNLGEAFLEGVIMGLVGFGWLALLRRLPRLFSRFSGRAV